jgi:SMP-30/Gluconolactonase/LRE-like region
VVWMKNNGDSRLEKPATCSGSAHEIVSGEPEIVANYSCIIGENPLWHPLEKRLYWCDISSGRLFRYEPATGKHEQCYEGRTIGGFTMQADGSLLLFMDRGEIGLWREGRPLALIAQIPSERATRFNDVIADPRGRVSSAARCLVRKPKEVFTVSTWTALFTRFLRASVARTAWPLRWIEEVITTPIPSHAKSISSITTLKTDRSKLPVSMLALPNRMGFPTELRSMQMAGCGPLSGMAPAS